VWHSRRYLPHFDSPGVVQMITFRLADALPVGILAEVSREAADAADRRARIEAVLDAGRGSCSLGDPLVAQTIQNALLYFDSERYRLIAWVVMPNHVHTIIEAMLGYSISDIVHSWKSFTAKEANRLLGQTGEFWQPDYYDCAIRDERHLTSAIRYIHENPYKAGLVSRAEEWVFGSGRLAGPTPGTGETPALPGRGRGTQGRLRQ
jgi:REP element-mobilizing transposase RayT